MASTTAPTAATGAAVFSKGPSERRPPTTALVSGKRCLCMEGWCISVGGNGGILWDVSGR